MVDGIHSCRSCSPGSLRELAEVGFGSAAPYSINQCPGLGVGVGGGGGGQVNHQGCVNASGSPALSK